MNGIVGKVVDKALDRPELSIERRREILQREIAKYTARGFLVVSQTDTTAQLRKPKRFSFLWAIFWFFMLIIGLVIYLFWYWAKRDELIFLEVGPTGRVIVRK